MTLIPHRTVAGQIAAHLRAEIDKGTWRGWLPSERELCQTLRASRNTIRAAVNQLKAEGTVVSSRGVGNRVAADLVNTGGNSQTRTVGVVVPIPVAGLRPLVALWIDELKDMLIEAGCLLRVHEGRQYYLPNPGRALERLVGHAHHDAWVLVLSSESMQRWFARRGLPCVVAGSVYPDVELACCDVDFGAIGRHAAGVLFRAGHRHVALLSHESRRAGEIASERGFLDGMQAFTGEETSAEVFYHRDDVESIDRALKRLSVRKRPPTALLMSNSYAYLTVSSLLAARGRRVPQDISLMSRDDDAFLRALFPAPARYVVTPHAFASKLIGPVLQLMSGAKVRRLQTYLLPRFTPGGSISAPTRAP